MKHKIDISDWVKREAGWWVNEKTECQVCMEHDGKWHSYASDDVTVKDSPKFSTMREAMLDADRRENAKERRCARKCK